MIKLVRIVIEKMFFTHYGEFNWISVTAIIAIFTLLISTIFNQRKLKADLVSKARLDWMNRVRKLYATFIADFGKYKYLYDSLFVEHEGKKSELDDLMNEIRKTYYELNLYIPINCSNKLLLRNIELLWNELSYISDYYNYGRSKGYILSVKLGQKRSNYDEVIDIYLSNLMIKASRDGSEFFKKEWEKTKKGK